MQDIRWDFVRNDVAVVQGDDGGDFAVASTCSQQNAKLLFIKSCVNIFQPQYGTAMEERAYNITDGEVQRIVTRAKSQIREDGASQISILYSRNSDGLYDFQIGAKYAGE